MDGDLFQGVLLGLLALGLIVLVALLATLGGIRKALEQRATQSAGDDLLRGSREASEPEPAQETTQTPEPEAARATGQPAQTAAGTAQAATIRGVLEQHGLQGDQETGGTTAASSSSATRSEPAREEPVQQGVVDSVFAAHADDPQEEPFQRDGRWWFRRGDELLLYDEATGQWQPAPGDAPGSGSALATSTAQTQTATTTQATPDVADQVATYWKCPTCGAVNGSTAASCRMCFAARP